MGTRGYKVFRFRGRYYRFYNNYDSYPEGLGQNLVNEIPTDPEAYQEWLAKRRKEALEWHVALERFLCLTPADYEDDEHDAGEHPWGVETDTLPDFTPAFNDLYIEWVYTIDLDNEVFTIDNGAHLHLNRIPTPAWINALAHGRRGDRVLLPGIVPKEAIADLILKLPSPSASMLELHARLDVRMVEAKGLNAFPPMQRHGPLLRARIFRSFQKVQEPVLSAILLGWSPGDFVFRETAYALLCLASASLNFSLVPLHLISRKPTVGYSDIESTNDNGREAEFLAQMGVGRHLEGFLPGSTPDSTMYWFDGVLVHLVAQLIDLPELICAAVASVVEHCRIQRPNQCVNAILMAIEHIVLMRVFPDGRVERTELLTLFDLDMHISMNASNRHSDETFEKMQIRKKKAVEKREAERRKRQKRYAKQSKAYQKVRSQKTQATSDEQTEEAPQSEESDHDSEESDIDTEEVEEDDDNIEEQTCWPAAGFERPFSEDTEKSFMALVQFLETSTRQQLPPSRPKEGVFPTEIYEMIIMRLPDLQTHRACMQVSRIFRDLCQENLMMTDDIVFQSNDATRTYDQPSASFPALRMKTASMGLIQEVTLNNQMSTDYFSGLQAIRRIQLFWLIAVGGEHNRRSVLPNFTMSFDPSE